MVGGEITTEQKKTEKLRKTQRDEEICDDFLISMRLEEDLGDNFQVCFDRFAPVIDGLLQLYTTKEKLGIVLVSPVNEFLHTSSSATTDE